MIMNSFNYLMSHNKLSNYCHINMKEDSVYQFLSMCRANYMKHVLL